MRDGWREATLGEVATRRKDFTPVVADTLYRVVGVQRSGWGLVDRDPIRGDSMKFDKLLELHTDDLVYRTITAFEAPSAVVLSEFDGAFVTPQTFPTYAIDRDRLLPGYMALLTTAPEFHEAMSTRCVGSVLRRKTLSQSAFESIPVALPPLDEQRRIVDLIAAVDDAVDAADAEADTAETARDEILTVMLAARDGWRETTLGEVATRTIGRTPPRNDSSMWATSTERPFVTIADLGLNRTVTAREGVSELAEASGHAKRFPAGSLLLSFKLSIGRVGVADRDVFTNEAIARLAPVDGVLRDFLAIALENVNWEELGSRAVKGKTMNKSSLDAVPITLPPLDEQRRIVATVKSVDDALDAARATADALRTLRSNLLTVLLSGEHEIPSSYDVLLEEVA